MSFSPCETRLSSPDKPQASLIISSLSGEHTLSLDSVCSISHSPLVLSNDVYSLCFFNVRSESSGELAFFLPAQLGVNNCESVVSSPRTMNLLEVKVFHSGE